MALGFTTSGTYGSRAIIYDKGLNIETEPQVFVAKFGDGYEHRMVKGINNTPIKFTMSFNNRTKEEIDDIIGYVSSLNAVTAFNIVIPDDNEGGNEKTINVVADKWTRKLAYGLYYSATVECHEVFE